MKKCGALGCGVLLFACAVQYAQAFEAGKTRFSPYGSSYLMYPQLTNNRHGSDDVSMEGKYSFKYVLYDCEFEGALEGDSCSNNNQIFLSYTGEFDFYVNFLDKGRDSGPVINRTSNPGFHWKKTYIEDGSMDYGTKVIWSELSLQHRSDGQVTEIDELDGSGNLKTQSIYEQDPNDEYFDSLSRGSNYVQLATGIRINGEGKEQVNCDETASCFDLAFSLKGYLTHSDEVNWGPLAGTGVKIHDYDILRIKYDNTHSVNSQYCREEGSNCSWLEWLFPGQIKEVTWQFEYTVGTGGFNTDSLDINVVFPVSSDRDSFDIPLFIGMHFGPMDRLSNYTESMNSIGFGLMFSK